MQIKHCVQEKMDTINQNCPLIRSLTISSTAFCNEGGVDFRKWGALQELRLIDAALGKISHLAPNLLTISATFSAIASEGTEYSFFRSVHH